MGLRAQLEGIVDCRGTLDDSYDGKTIFRFSPLQGTQNGTNLTFQIPQSRVVVTPTGFSPIVFPQIYKNDNPLNFLVDYTLPSPKQGTVLYSSAATPKQDDSIEVTFSWTWFDDVELDHHLMRGAGKIGFSAYYTQPSTIPNTEVIPSNENLPTDIPDGLFDAIIQMGASLAAKALALRFSMKYDFGAGDQSFSPSQMAKSYGELSDKLEKSALNARDDFYKGQGRQYRPSTGQTGYILPNWTPPR